MTVFISLIAALIGLILYGVTEGKLSEIGRLLYFAGILVFLLALGQRTVSLLGK